MLRKISLLLQHLLKLTLKHPLKQASAQSLQLVDLPQIPLPVDRDGWVTYWMAQGQPWRTEPEIDLQRREELTQRRSIVPDVSQGKYRFKGIKLSRADVEWLLATHENGRGPVNWNDGNQRNREGLDLRGADLCQVNLSNLPLACLRGGLSEEEWLKAEEEPLRYEAAILMERTILKGAHLEGAILNRAFLERATLNGAHLEGANFTSARLQHARLKNAHLEGADFKWAHLEYAHLKGANLSGTNLTSAYMERAHLEQINLSSANGVGPQITDIHWSDTHLAVVRWSQMTMLGDEHKARQKDHNGKVKNRSLRLDEYEVAVRANRQLAVALQSRGLNEVATRFAYRAQVLQRSVLWLQILQRGMKFRKRVRLFISWLASWFLFLLAGYGYRPERSFLAYLLVIASFATTYFLLGVTPIKSHHLEWYEAIVVSMTAFHGRGFLADQFKPGDPQAFIAAFEAFVGLIIEVTFIATLTQRFFNK